MSGDFYVKSVIDQCGSSAIPKSSRNPISPQFR
jgi:hypothetical protein